MCIRDRDDIEQDESAEAKELADVQHGAHASAHKLLDGNDESNDRLSSSVEGENISVAELPKAKISWVCQFCATDNLSYPANELVCVRCNKASSFAAMVNR